VERHLAKYVFAIAAFGILSCNDKKAQVVFKNDQQDTATTQSEIKVYKLKKKSLASDFNYSKLDDIDDNIEDTLNVKSIFEPVAGHFVYYQFLATFRGYSFDETDKVFHDILIIKTDKSNKIIDAYQYTLEWAEPPCQYDLFKATSKDLDLTDSMDIATLKFKRTYSWNEKDKFLKESGLIRLK
jgi:hypothetical protein